MWWMLAMAALAGPPEGLIVEEADTWEDAWPTLQEGPEGCWEVVGRGTWDWDFGRFGRTKGDAGFIAKLQDGTWIDVVVRSFGEEVEMDRRPPVRMYPHDQLRFLPMFGSFGPDSYDRADDTIDVLSVLTEELGGSVSYAWSEWSEAQQAVVLQRVVPLSDAASGPEALMKVVFPGGDPLPVRADITVDKPFSVPGRRIGRITHAEAHLRGKAFADQVFPEIEALSFEAAALGLRFYGSQTIRYESFRPCGGAVHADTNPINP